MDFLVKKNIIKKNKIIVDIGQKHTKILTVSYEKGRVTIHSSYKVDVTACFFEGELYDVKELVKKIYGALSRRKLARGTEISLSLPSYMTAHKIVSIKNTKLKALDKSVKKEYATLGKVNSVTHNFDWAYLGEREENSETIQYCMIGSVSKAHIIPLLNELEKRQLRVTTVSFPVYNLVSLGDLYLNDYEHPNKILLDFGETSSRVVVECGGVAVYSRTIEIGFDTFTNSLYNAFGNVSVPEIAALLTEPDIDKADFPSGLHDKGAFFDIVDKLAGDFQNELIRIIQMCDEDGFSVSKIICCGNIIDGMLKVFGENGITVETFDIQKERSANGSSYTVTVDSAEADAGFAGAIGLAVNTLQVTSNNL